MKEFQLKPEKKKSQITLKRKGPVNLSLEGEKGKERERERERESE